MFIKVSLDNGGGGIRTHGALADTLVFKTRALNHSTTPPKGLFSFSHLNSIAKGSDSLQYEFLPV